MLLAVDTNVIVRLAAGDSPSQAARARVVFENERIFISKTVLLETECVLRQTYEFPRSSILRFLGGLVSMPNVQAENESQVLAALALAENGMDFADALHLKATPSGGSFATFDERLRKRAARIGIKSVAP